MYGDTATQAHINTTCFHPALIDLRLLHRRDISHRLLSLQHTVLPPAQQWVTLPISYAEVHLWKDSERAGDLWTGRWTRQTLQEILLEHTDSQIPRSNYASALHWLTHKMLSQPCTPHGDTF